MSAITDLIRRELLRAQAGTRQAFRAVLGSLALRTRQQRAVATGLADEQLDGMELFQHFGFTSAPPSGAQLIVVPLGGRTSASVIVATEHGAYRIALDAPGEARVYNQWGDFVHLKQDRSIHLKAQAQVFVETDVFRVEAATRIELASPELLVKAATRARFETPLVQATQVMQPQQLTVGLTGPGTATMNGGTLNFNNVVLNYAGCTVSYAGGAITHDGKAIGATHTHDETGTRTTPPN